MERCQQLGINGCFLQTIQIMYKRILMRVRVNGSLGREFSTTMGTKQGDPLSPTLFGLFLEQLDEMIRHLRPASGRRYRIMSYFMINGYQTFYMLMTLH